MYLFYPVSSLRTSVSARVRRVDVAAGLRFARRAGDMIEGDTGLKADLKILAQMAAQAVKSGKESLFMAGKNRAGGA